MVQERQRVMGECAAWHFIQIASMFGDVKATPAEINPFKVARPKSPEVQRIEAWQRKRRLRAMAKSMAEREQGKGKG